MMETRKLIQFGKNSHVVSLPKSWLTSNNVSKGDVLSIEEKPGSLLIHAQGQQLSEIEATIIFDHDDLRLFQTELTGHYKAGADLIVIKGSKLYEHGERIKEMIHWLAGMEIIDQSLDTIVIKDLIDVKQITLQSLTNRMDMMIRSLFQDLLREELIPNHALRERDKDINRLQFLITRVIRKLSQNPSLGNVIGTRVDQAYYADKVAWSLERIGDCIKRGDDDMLHCASEVQQRLREDFKKVYALYQVVLRCYTKLDAQQALQLHGTLEDCRKQYTDKVRGAKDHNEVLALENVKNICRELRVITRAAIELSHLPR